MCRCGITTTQHKPGGEPTMKSTAVGIDLAKNVFQIHGVSETGRL